MTIKQIFGHELVEISVTPEPHDCGAKPERLVLLPDSSGDYNDGLSASVAWPTPMG